MDRLFEDPWRLVTGMAAGSGPAVDVLERRDDIVVRAEVAGVDPKDIDVRLTDDAVTIRGERRAEERADEAGFYRSERHYGAFVRTVGLPAPVDTGRATAHFRHGLLEIVAPRRADDTHGRKVPVNTQ